MKNLFLALGILLFLSFSCKNADTHEAASTTEGTDPISAISKQLESDPKNLDLLFKRAQLFYDREGFEPAVKDLELAKSIDSTNLPVLTLLADAYMDNYQSKNALSTLENAAFLHPTSIKTLLKLSEFQFILKRYEDAMVTLGKIKEIEPNNSEMYFMAGYVMRENGQDEGAIVAFQSCVEQDPDNVEAWVNLGEMWSVKNKDLALKFFDNALQVDPNSVMALHAKAFFLSENKDLNGAIQLYKKINLIDAQYSDAYYNAGLIYMNMDSIAKAKAMFDLNTKIEPTSAKAYYFRGLASELQGDKEAAKKDYEQSIALDPTDKRAENALTKINAKK